MSTNPFYDKAAPVEGTLRFAIQEGLASAGEKKYWYAKLAEIEAAVVAWTARTPPAERTKNDRGDAAEQLAAGGTMSDEPTASRSASTNSGDKALVLAAFAAEEIERLTAKVDAAEQLAEALQLVLDEFQSYQHFGPVEKNAYDAGYAALAAFSTPRKETDGT